MIALNHRSRWSEDKPATHIVVDLGRGGITSGRSGQATGRLAGFGRLEMCHRRRALAGVGFSMPRLG